MTIGKMIRSISMGLVFAVIAIGFLPLLVVYSFVEIVGMSELYSSPMLLVQKIFGLKDSDT